MTTPGAVPVPVLLVAAAPATRAVVCDELDRRYSSDYRIEPVAVDDAAARIAELRDAGDDLALVLADDPMHAEDGSTVFTIAKEAFPDVRRGLLMRWGGWADPTTAAQVRRLLSGVQIDTYVVVPRHSPDERFHRAIAEFLEEFARGADARHPGFTVIGDDAQPRTHALANLLLRGGVHHDRLAPDHPDAAKLLDDSDVAYSGVPLVRTADGRVLVDPSDAELAAAHGLETSLPDQVVDVAIVGAGPAGLAAAVYASSEGLDTLVLEGESVGGQAGSSSLIRNYLGFPRGVAGSDLAQRAYQQAWMFGARFAHARPVTGLDTSDPRRFALTVDAGPGAEPGVVHARSVILATGVSYRRLAVPSLEPFIGATVFYGVSAAEARAQTGRDVLIVGGGNSAGQAALHVARYARSVSLVVRGTSLADSMSQYLIEQLAAVGVEIRTESRIAAAHPDDEGRLAAIDLEHTGTGARTTVPAGAVFITIGARPRTDWVGDAVLRDRWGSIITGPDVVAEGGRRLWPYERQPSAHEASVPGIFAVGDVRRGSIKRVASAVGEGSVTVSAVHRHLGEFDAP
ncbi:NAD(P)/FAD-dependent oxidoreductase [Agromyces mangrovi Wang et al. 2018]|uniref:FAD-dependent oxidoreductase n=1 Tax=Agromyces mangrovi TaxID=1858653 RepID=UPI002573256E|nr:FAD-dependent oxidoreductase [Agromyces mangrovi]BDZ65580.1 fused response regulator/thioredoxin-disulfide reductase [Agromyces mangrovi]